MKAAVSRDISARCKGLIHAVRWTPIPGDADDSASAARDHLATPTAQVSAECLVRMGDPNPSWQELEFNACSDAMAVDRRL